MAITFADVKNLVFVIVFFMIARPVLPVLEYIINYNYIATVLCENKAKPKLHCNGKCHLMKELAKAAEQEKPVSEKKSGHTEVELLFFQPFAEITFNSPFVKTSGKKHPVYKNLYSHLAGYAVFHPPLIAA